MLMLIRKEDALRIEANSFLCFCVLGPSRLLLSLQLSCPNSKYGTVSTHRHLCRTPLICCCSTANPCAMSAESDLEAKIRHHVGRSWPWQRSSPGLHRVGPLPLRGGNELSAACKQLCASVCPPCALLQLVHSGERERLKQLLRDKLTECGWRDEVKQRCRGGERGGNQSSQPAQLLLSAQQHITRTLLQSAHTGCSPAHNLHDSHPPHPTCPTRRPRPQLLLTPPRSPALSCAVLRICPQHACACALCCAVL